MKSFFACALMTATPLLGATSDLPTVTTNLAGLTNAVSTPSTGSTNAPKVPKPIITHTVKALPVIIRGPYLQCGTTNSMVIRWRTDVPTPSIVRYGLSVSDLNKKTNSSGNLTEHVVLLSGLLPDTRYYYAVGSPDCPILVTLTNNMLTVSTTNGPMAVSTTQRVQLANVTNQALTLSVFKNQLIINNPKNGKVVNSTNAVLVVSTTNNALLVTWTNRTLAATTTNQTRALGSASLRSARAGFGSFAVLTTNLTTVGRNTNTFFYTSPPIGKRQPVRMWVLGDPGTRKGEQKMVRDAYLRYTGDRRTDLWLMLGDNAYMDGSDIEYQGSVFQSYPDMLKTSVLWPTLGNHDANSANSATQSGIYYDIFTLPTQGQAGGVMSGTEAYYSFDHANIHVICLDSANSDRSTNGPMLKWLKEDLAANRQDWCIAYWHHPPYTKGSHDSDNEKEAEGIMRDLRTVFVPVLEAGGVDLVLSGHSHAYERSFLLDGHYGRSYTLEEDENILANEDGRADGWGIYHKATPGHAAHEGTVYMVAGSSGQTSGGRLLHPAMYTGLNILGSVVLDFDGLRLESRFIDTNSLVRDYFTIQKGSHDAAAMKRRAESFIEVRGMRIPDHLKLLLRTDDRVPNLAVATNARPSDEELLLELYGQSSDLSQKVMLTWALACVGNAEVVTNFMRLLTTQFKGKEISPRQELVCLNTLQALGLLAARYEAPYEFLRKGVNGAFWQTNDFWISSRGYKSAGLLAAWSIRALGLSGRPEALQTLASLRKKGAEYKIKEHPEYLRRFSDDLAKAVSDCEAFQELGANAFQKWTLTRKPDEIDQ